MPEDMPKDLAPVIVRLILRYLSGALVAWGLIAPETGATLLSDPDLQALLLLVVGTTIATATEIAYARARRNGGST